ncbi:hypothetical protein C8R46DRAFT_1302786 [Mycena filopes]|nr:hypothetical protein C8R46DRAFT_1302786 [Mycena filopes]
MPRLLLSLSVSGLVLLYIPFATAQSRLFKQPSQPLRLILTKRDSAISHSAALAIGFTLLGIGLLIFVSLACCGCCSTSTRTAAAVTATDEGEGEGGATVTELDGEPATTEPAGNAKSELADEVALLRARVQQLEEEERAQAQFYGLELRVQGRRRFTYMYPSAPERQRRIFSTQPHRSWLRGMCMKVRRTERGLLVRGARKCRMWENTWRSPWCHVKFSRLGRGYSVGRETLSSSTTSNFRSTTPIEWSGNATDEESESQPRHLGQRKTNEGCCVTGWGGHFPYMRRERLKQRDRGILIFPQKIESEVGKIVARLLNATEPLHRMGEGCEGVPENARFAEKEFLRRHRCMVVEGKGDVHVILSLPNTNNLLLRLTAMGIPSTLSGLSHRPDFWSLLDSYLDFRHLSHMYWGTGLEKHPAN